MIDVKLTLTNQEVQAFYRELSRMVEQQLVPRMIGEASDKKDSATPAYEVVRRLVIAMGQPWPIRRQQRARRHVKPTREPS